MALPTTPPYNPIFNYPSNKLYQYEVYPILLSCNFIVDHTNGNGLGIRSLKGNGIANVFMNTNQTPGAGNYGLVNPNPAAGLILVQFENNFNRYLSGFSGFVSPLSGSNVTVGSTTLTQGLAYVITSLGTTTTATWQRLGFPVGFTPAVGATFIASGSAHGSAGTGTVQLPTKSGITTMEVVGDPNQTFQNSSLYTNGGAQMVIQTLGATDSSTTTLIQTAPADNSVVGLNFYLSNSSVSVNGQ